MKKFLERSACVAAGVLVASPVTQVSAAELVTNGDFETGDFTGWTLSGGTEYFRIIDYCLSCPGRFTAEYNGPEIPDPPLTWEGLTGTLSQTLTTVAGERYKVSFFADNFGDPPNFLGVNFGDVNLLSQRDAEADNYNPFFSYSVTASSASTVLSFDLLHNEQGEWRLDDISVVEAIPEPATWAMMLLGFLAIGTSVRWSKISRAKVRYAL